MRCITVTQLPSWFSMNHHSCPSLWSWMLLTLFSQHSIVDKKAPSVLLLFSPLSPSEQKYDVGNSELLGVELSLEEWKHWLEVMKNPFIAWTDHKNLRYIYIDHLYS